MTRRIRTVKPEWLEDEKLAAASDAARVLSIGLFILADDEGRGRASVATLAAECWRFELERDDGARAPEVLAKAREALRELSEMRFVSLYEVDGQRYYHLRNWTRHQRVDKPTPSKLPEPPKQSKSAPLASHSESVSRDSREVPATEGKGREGKGRDLEGSGVATREVLQERSFADMACEAWTNAVAERGGAFVPHPTRDAPTFKAIGASVNATRGDVALSAALASSARAHLAGRTSGGSKPEWWLEKLQIAASKGTSANNVSPESDFVPSPITRTA